MATRAAAKKNSSTDAVALLRADHEKVKKLFKDFERMHKAEDDEGAEQIAAKICNELKIHTSLEEEIFYPEVRAAIADDDLLDEAEVEHQSAKDLIGQIEEMNAADEKYAAKVMVLGEYVNHHIEEEQKEMFPKVKRAKLDLKALGERLRERKQELMGEMGIAHDEEEEKSEARSSARKPRAGRTVHAGR